MSIKLCVRNLARTTTEHELEELFQRFGHIESAAVEITHDPICTVVLGYIEMREEEDAERAVRQLNFSQHKDRVIGVSKNQAPQGAPGSDHADLGLQQPDRIE